MPKKAHGRPAKGKARARKPQSRPSDISTSARPVEPAAPSIPAAATASPAAAMSARRGPLRRAPAITINYAYLRHDLNLLAVLAPLMVVLLVISYFVFHTA